MKQFYYKARNLSGNIVKGTIEAEDLIIAKTRLRKQYLIPVSINEKAKVFVISKVNTSVPIKVLAASVRQFATLIDSGIPVSQSLSILKNSTTNRGLAQVYAILDKKVMKGEKLSEAMASFPKMFGRIFISMVEVGEKGGVLQEVLDKMASYMEKSNRIRSKVRGAIWYPAGILVVGICVVGFIMVYVIPKFSEFFASSNQELPLITQFVVSVSNTIRSYWYAIPLVGFLIVISIRHIIKNPVTTQYYHTFVFRFPLLGKLIKISEMAKICRTISILLKSGVDIVNTLQLAEQVSTNVNIKKTIKQSRQSVVDGGPMSKSFEASPYVPAMVSRMIAVGEQSGSIDGMLSRVADYYEHDVEQLTETLSTLIEPILIVVLGGLVAFIIVAMYMPIFKMSGGI